MTYRVVKRKSDGELLDVALIDSDYIMAKELVDKLNKDGRRTKSGTFLVETEGG